MEVFTRLSDMTGSCQEIPKIVKGSMTVRHDSADGIARRVSFALKSSVH